MAYLSCCSVVADYKFFGFTYVKLEVVSAPVCEVGDGVLVCEMNFLPLSSTSMVESEYLKYVVVGELLL